MREPNGLAVVGNKSFADMLLNGFAGELVQVKTGPMAKIVSMNALLYSADHERGCFAGSLFGRKLFPGAGDIKALMDSLNVTF